MVKRQQPSDLRAREDPAVWLLAVLLVLAMSFGVYLYVRTTHVPANNCFQGNYPCKIDGGRA